MTKFIEEKAHKKMFLRRKSLHSKTCKMNYDRITRNEKCVKKEPKCENSDDHEKTNVKNRNEIEAV